MSQVLIHRYPEVWDEQLEVIVENLQKYILHEIIKNIYSGETIDQLEMSIRTLLYFMQGIEDEKSIK